MLGLVFALIAMLLVVGCTAAGPTSEPTKDMFSFSTGLSPGDSSGEFTITSDGDSSGGFTVTSDGDSGGGFTVTSDGDSDANVVVVEEDTGSSLRSLKKQ